MATKPTGHIGTPAQAFRPRDQTWPGQQQLPSVSIEMA
jgi:hypothetical protein